MARLYAISASASEIADQFEVATPDDVNVPSEIVEGMTGPVVVEREGTRLLKAASWGFPRQTSEMRWRGEPVGRIGLGAHSNMGSTFRAV